MMVTVTRPDGSSVEHRGASHSFEEAGPAPYVPPLTPERLAELAVEGHDPALEPDAAYHPHALVIVGPDGSSTRYEPGDWTAVAAATEDDPPRAVPAVDLGVGERKAWVLNARPAAPVDCRVDPAGPVDLQVDEAGRLLVEAVAPGETTLTVHLDADTALVVRLRVQGPDALVEVPR